MSFKQSPIPASARTVTVCCKIPNGLQLQLQTQQTRLVEGRGAGGEWTAREEKM